jgi:hypothetical protein
MEDRPGIINWKLLRDTKNSEREGSKREWY